MTDSLKNTPEPLDAAESPAPEVLVQRQGMFGTQQSDVSGYGDLQTVVTTPPAATRPYGSFFDDVVDVLTEVLEDQKVSTEAVQKVIVDRGELTLQVRREDLLAVMQILRDDQDLRFEMCASVSGVHYPDHAGNELHVVYHIVSITHSRRIRVETSAPEADPHVPSVVSIYPSADWHERETWDMFGVIFDGHPALTRILMPDDWPGHPQRKDYPLGGIPVEYKGAQIPPPDTRRSYR